MTVDEVVRRAQVEDCPDLLRLEAIARDGIREVRGGALRLQECATVGDWGARITDPHWLVLIGSLDGVIVASLAMRLSAEADRGLISHVYVEVEGRELGLGDMLVEQAISAVLAAGLSGIEAVALPGDRETKNLFERAGLTARKLTVYKSLRARADPDLSDVVAEAFP